MARSSQRVRFLPSTAPACREATIAPYAEKVVPGCLFSGDQRGIGNAGLQLGPPIAEQPVIDLYFAGTAVSQQDCIGLLFDFALNGPISISDKAIQRNARSEPTSPSNACWAATNHVLWRYSYVLKPKWLMPVALK